MNTQTKNIISSSMLLVLLTGCSGMTGGTIGQQADSGDGASAQNSTTNTTSDSGVTHTHSGVAHTHVLPAGGLSHSHNYNSSAGKKTCKPCTAQPRPTYTPPRQTYTPPRQPYTPPRPTYTPPRPVAQSNGNCHVHQGRRHCHALPASGTNHAHNQSAAPVRPAPVRPAPVRPAPVRPAPVRPAPPKTTTTYYDYSGTGATAAETNTSSYYDYSVVKSPTRKGLVSHAHNGKTHSHVLPAAGTNHTHNTGTSYAGRSSSYYNGGHTTTTTSASTAPRTGYTSYSRNTGGSGNTYTVKPKDSVFQVMRNTGVYWKTIIKLNNLIAPDYTIVPGQTLRLK